MRAVHVLAICAMATIGSAASAQEIDWKKVDEAIGRSAAVVAGDVHRYGFPRTDLTVTLDGVTIKPRPRAACCKIRGVNWTTCF